MLFRSTVWPLWGADSAQSFPHDGKHPGFRDFFPDFGGYRFIVMSLPPDSDGGVATGSMPDTMTPEQEARLGVLSNHSAEPDHPGMHRTDTVDFEIVIDGEAGLEFDDGKTIILRRGDCFVQNGTRHRWFNPGSVPAIVACVILGGHPRK